MKGNNVMINQPLVTGIITTYKRKPEIVVRAAKSVLNQTYKNIELIVVDDSPADFYLRRSVESSIRALGENIQYILHEVNQGACAARNTGLLAARGEFVAYLDDDDEWMPTKLEKMLPFFSNKDIGLVYCGSTVYNEITGESNYFYQKFIRGNVYDQMLTFNYIGSTSFPIMRRELLLRINGFDPLMKSCQDYDVWLRLARICSFEYTEEALVRYHTHGGEQISKNYSNVVSGHLRIIEKNKKALYNNKKAYNSQLLMLVDGYAGVAQYWNCTKTYLKAVIKAPQNIYENLRGLYAVFNTIMGRR